MAHSIWLPPLASVQPNVNEKANTVMLRMRRDKGFLRLEWQGLYTNTLFSSNGCMRTRERPTERENRDKRIKRRSLHVCLHPNRAHRLQACTKQDISITRLEDVQS